MMSARVSNIELFRQWQRSNTPIDTLIERLHRPPTEAMQAGTALHLALENLSAGQPVNELKANGYTFIIMCDISLPPVQFREVRTFKRYGNLIVTGKSDAIHGRNITDYKTTAYFRPEGYLTGYQWRYYLDLFGADIFSWPIFEIKQHKKRPNIYTVENYHLLTATRYPAMHDDCMALANDFYNCFKNIPEAVPAIEENHLLT